MLFAPEKSLRGGGTGVYTDIAQICQSVQLAWGANIRLVDKKNKINN